MKKLLLILFLYLLVEGDNVIGDGLYVYHRGKHAVDELKTKVDEYYPKIEAVDSVLMKTLSAESLTTTDVAFLLRFRFYPGFVELRIFFFVHDGYW